MCQNGFREKHSTITAVYKYVQQILNTSNNQEYPVGILLDVSKAYDKVQHNILLNKLYDIGIRGLTHKWFQTYLKDRQQLVEIEYYDTKTNEIQKIRSQYKTINASIPQGSVVGCLLFLIYINDLPKIINDTCVLFADDISILTKCQNDLNLTEKLTYLFDSITDWMNDHNLQINFLKTKLMIYRPRQKPPLNITFKYNNIEINIVNEFTLLGMELDTHINWKSHVTKLTKKLSKFTYALKEIKKSTDFKTALITYYAYAYAWLSYGIILWGNSTESPSLLILQKNLSEY